LAVLLRTVVQNHRRRRFVSARDRCQRLLWMPSYLHAWRSHSVAPKRRRHWRSVHWDFGFQRTQQPNRSLLAPRHWVGRRQQEIAARAKPRWVRVLDQLGCFESLQRGAPTRTPWSMGFPVRMEIDPDSLSARPLQHRQATASWLSETAVPVVRRHRHRPSHYEVYLTTLTRSRPAIVGRFWRDDLSGWYRVTSLAVPHLEHARLLLQRTAKRRELVRFADLLLPQLPPSNSSDVAAQWHLLRAITTPCFPARLRRATSPSWADSDCDSLPSEASLKPRLRCWANYWPSTARRQQLPSLTQSSMGWLQPTARLLLLWQTARRSTRALPGSVPSFQLVVRWQQRLSRNSTVLGALSCETADSRLVSGFVPVAVQPDLAARVAQRLWPRPRAQSDYSARSLKAASDSR
jgi:hypothetical protein